MYHIIIHCKPKKEKKEFYGKVLGAYASILIDYKNYEGVIELSKYYVEEEGWEILNFEEEYYTFENKEELSEDYQQYFEEVLEYGYALIFNMYDQTDEEENFIAPKEGHRPPKNTN